MPQTPLDIIKAHVLTSKMSLRNHTDRNIVSVVEIRSVSYGDHSVHLIDENGIFSHAQNVAIMR